MSGGTISNLIPESIVWKIIYNQLFVGEDKKQTFVGILYLFQCDKVIYNSTEFGGYIIVMDIDSEALSEFSISTR